MNNTAEIQIPDLHDLDELPVIRVAVDALVNSDSPRGDGESPEHVRTRAETMDDNQLPPIIIHGKTFRIIDGMHRLCAAKLRGESEIDARLFEGDDASSFVLAVKLNMMHGLPLSLRDRKAAAIRIMNLYSGWSDRKIASVVGLAAKTVAVIRPAPVGANSQQGVRVGLDGRLYPVDGSERRVAAVKLIAENPHASLREIARQAGISPETVRRIRLSMSSNSGERAVNEHRARVGSKDSTYPTSGPADQKLIHHAHPNGDVVSSETSAVKSLRADPAFRSGGPGRFLLRVLTAQEIIEKDGMRIVYSVPTHCLDWLAQAIRVYSNAWLRFAELVETRLREEGFSAGGRMEHHA